MHSSVNKDCWWFVHAVLLWNCKKKHSHSDVLFLMSIPLNSNEIYILADRNNKPFAKITLGSEESQWVFLVCLIQLNKKKIICVHKLVPSTLTELKSHCDRWQVVKWLLLFYRGFKEKQKWTTTLWCFIYCTGALWAHPYCKHFLQSQVSSETWLSCVLPWLHI